MYAIGQCTGVVAGSEPIAGKSHFPVLGIDSDNEGVFIHDALTQFGADRGIEFIRSRACRKNNQAWVEQKNGAGNIRFLREQRYNGRVVIHGNR